MNKYGLDIIRTRLGKATPGPWDAISGVIVDDSWRDIISIFRSGEDESVNRDEDFELAALAPELAEEVLRLHHQIEELRQYYFAESETNNGRRHLAKDQGEAAVSATRFREQAYFVYLLNRLKEGCLDEEDFI
ncbi:hypothetical protein FYJ88_03740 [Corynebacterium urealyticum]|uniref:hypothetical protein n=1 Tax=Corynebacterium urealyticum TaxID=43771 RepID=UPI0011E72B75|nr:hypothetical protein [Corynebacterium urealyticum]TYR17949.1 hypothetical protein FYJ88_03740 [Corynebacterium urealyticum]